MPADGGNGGKGGDVLIQADARVKSLRNVERVQTAPAGRPGGSHGQRGGDGANLVVSVPCGTVVLSTMGAFQSSQRHATLSRPGPFACLQPQAVSRAAEPSQVLWTAAVMASAVLNAVQLRANPSKR